MADDSETAFWDRLQGRDYAEEGIPMILAVSVAGADAPSPPEPELAQAFRDAAARLRQARPATPASVTEMLAARELDALAVP